MIKKEFTDKEKIEHFDRLHLAASNYYESVMDGSYHEDSDEEHYIFEAVIEILGKDVWKDINSKL